MFNSSQSLTTCLIGSALQGSSADKGLSRKHGHDVDVQPRQNVQEARTKRAFFKDRF